MKDLRKKAEKLHKKSEVDTSDLSQLELQKLIEELQIHQIELQVQNEELRDSREENEAAKKKYFNLFDLAPVGYMVLDKKGVITECNLKATEILGRRKDHMFNKPFVSFLDAISMSKFYEFFEYAQHNRLHEEFELLIQKQKEKRHLQLAISLFTDSQYLIVFSDITDKKLIEQELKESEERFRLLINSTSDVVFTLDTEQRHTGIYGDWAEKSGLSKEYFLGKTTQELLGDEVGVHIAANKRALKGETVSYEWQLKQKNIVKYFQTSLTPLMDNGHVSGIIGVGRDITALKETQQNLQEKNTTLEIAMQSGNMAWWVMEYPNGNLTFSARKAEMLGYSPNQFKHYTDFMTLVHPDDNEKAMKAMEKHLSGACHRYETEYRIKNKAGEYIWFYDVGSVVETDEAGKPTKICGIVFNINERKQAEEALKQSEERFRSVWEHSSDALVLSDAEGIVQAANPAYQNLYGFTLEQLLGKSFSIIFPKEQRKSAIKEYKAIFASKSLPDSFEALVRRADGSERIVDSRATFLMENEQRIAML